MKTARILLIVIFSIIHGNLSAQFFVTGNFGLNTSGGSSDNGTVKTDKPSKLSFTFSPMVGKFISQKIGIGIGFNFSLSNTKTTGTTVTIDKSSAFGLCPFIRYKVLTLNKFLVFSQANIGFSYSNPTTTMVGTTADETKTTNLYFNVVPGIAYNLNKKISFQTFINVLNFGYYLTTTKLNSEKETTSSFGLGAGLNNIVTIGNITIGAIYKF